MANLIKFVLIMKRRIINGLLNCIAYLPLGILYIISDFITFVLYYLIKYRRKVVRVNLTSSFPDRSLKEIKKIENSFYRYLGDQIVETIKTLHITDKELKKRVKVFNAEAVNRTLSQNKNAVLLMGHYCNWEWVQEIVNYFLPSICMASIYHPLNDKTFDEIFIRLRSRWKAHIVPMKRAPRFLLDKKNMPWVCGFIADAYTWHKNEDNWIDFLNHKTWFITGPEEIGEKVGADYFYLEMRRIKRGYYEITFHDIEPQEKGVTYPYTRQYWKDFERTIDKAPAYWLWSHKRWK